MKNYDNHYARKVGLKRFFLNLENNHFDRVIDKLILDLESKLEDLKLENDIQLEKGNFITQFQVNVLEKELFAICEMKINYAYKHFEFHLKFLIKSYYPETKENNLFKWNFVEDILKSKKIIPSKIDNFKEISELRNINNSIKHSRNIINDKTRGILEFRNKSKIKYFDLIKFYNRIEKSQLKFLESLNEKIEKDIYEFDENRLEEISNSFSERMDKETMKSFIEKLEKKNN